MEFYDVYVVLVGKRLVGFAVVDMQTTEKVFQFFLRKKIRFQKNILEKCCPNQRVLEKKLKDFSRVLEYDV